MTLPDETSQEFLNRILPETEFGDELGRTYRGRLYRREIAALLEPGVRRWPFDLELQLAYHFCREARAEE